LQKEVSFPVFFLVVLTLCIASNGWSFKWDDDALYLTSVGLRDGLQGKIRFYWIGILNCEDDVPEDEQVTLFGLV